MKKLLALNAALLLCLALLSGCARTGSVSETPETPEPPEPAAASAPTPASEPAGEPTSEPEPEQPKALTYHIEHTDLSEGLPVDMYFEIPVFEGDSAAVEKINADLAAVRKAYVENEAPGVLDMVRESMSSEYGPTKEAPYSNARSAAVETCTEQLVSVTIGYDWYMGGVLDYGVDTYNYNAVTGERIFLTDLLDGTESEIKESIVAALLEQYPEVEDAGVMETPMDAIRAKDINEFHFYVKDGAVQIAFNKYEITYGAAGAFLVTLPNAIKPLG